MIPAGAAAGAPYTPPPLQLVKDEPGGIVRGLLRRVGNSGYFFTGGDVGTGLSDPDGNEIDSFGDVGQMSTNPGNEGHVASANLWTTTLAGDIGELLGGAVAGMPIAFEGDPFATNEIIGSKLTLTAFMQETLIEAAKAVGDVGTINIRLLDLAPDGAVEEIAKGGKV